MERQRGLQPCGHLNLHSSHPASPIYKQMGVLTQTTLPDMLKPVVPGDGKKGSKRSGNIEDNRRDGGGASSWEPRGGGESRGRSWDDEG